MPLSHSPDDIRRLIGELCRRPEDIAKRILLSDLLEEHGLADAGEGIGVRLRDEIVSQETINILSACRVLFGASEKEPLLSLAGAYTNVVGFGLERVGAVETVTFRASVHIDFIARKLVIPSEFHPFFQISEVKLGRYNLISGSGSVPASVFSLNGPETIEHEVKAGEWISLVIENTSDVLRNFTACILGDDRPIRKVSEVVVTAKEEVAVPNALLRLQDEAASLKYKVEQLTKRGEEIVTGPGRQDADLETIRQVVREQGAKIQYLETSLEEALRKIRLHPTDPR